MGRLPCPSLSPRVCSNSCPLSQWCHPTISSSVTPLLLLPLIFPSIRLFSNESVLCIRWPKYWNFSFSVSPCNGYSGLISFRVDWFDLLAVQKTLKSLLQHHKSRLFGVGGNVGPGGPRSGPIADSYLYCLTSAYCFCISHLQRGKSIKTGIGSHQIVIWMSVTTVWYESKRLLFLPGSFFLFVFLFLYPLSLYLFNLTLLFPTQAFLFSFSFSFFFLHSVCECKVPVNVTTSSEAASV